MEYLATSTITLTSLAQLLGKISNMVINDRIQEQVEQALEAIHQVREQFFVTTSQGWKLTILGRRQLATDLFFQSPNNKMWATSCEILVASAKFLVALATRKAQFPTLLPRFYAWCTVLWLRPPLLSDQFSKIPKVEPLLSDYLL